MGGGAVVRIGVIRIAIAAIVLACLGAMAFLGVAVAVEPETVISGVNVLDTDLSGLTREMAEGKLLLLEKEIIQATPLVLRYGSKAWQIRPSKIGAVIDREKVLDEAMKAGRRGWLLQRLIQRRQAGKEGIRIPLYVKVDRSRLEQELKFISSEITAPPVDARLKINPDETLEVVPSREGIAVDIEKVLQDITGVYKSYDTAPEINLSLIKASPAKTTRDFLDMGVNGLLASYTTTFDIADADRSYNIKVAADALDGLFVAPGEAFSFNGMVGPRSSEAGYKNAKVIVNNEFVDGLGGGVCQVSSTLYNAVLLSGLEIIERNSHSLPVFYVPPGRDATVSFESVDFRFRNSTPRHIYIKSMYSPGRVSVKLYGNTDFRREVTIRTRVVETFPFKEVYQPDPSLKAGESRVIRNGISGMRVTAERIVLGSGAYKVESLPTSLYRPVDQLVHTGPGFSSPETAPPAAVSPASPVDTAVPGGVTGIPGGQPGGIVPPSVPEEKKSPQ